MIFSKRPLFLGLGWLALVLGVLGIFLPLFPTTPFALLAAYCFSKSSPRLHQYLLNQKTFGPLIRDWQESGVIKKEVKWTSSLMILIFFSISFYFSTASLFTKALLTFIGLLVQLFIWTRPSRPEQR